MTADGGGGDPDAADAPATAAPRDTTEDELAAACSSIARHLARTGARSVGLLPVGAPRRRRGKSSPDRPEASGLDLGPVLERLAAALAMFVEGTVGYIGPWT